MLVSRFMFIVGNFISRQRGDQEGLTIFGLSLRQTG